VLQQAHRHLNHDTASRSSSQQNIDSYIDSSRPLDLNTRKYRVNNYCAWLNSLKLAASFGVQVDGHAGRMVTPGTSVFWRIRAIPVSLTS
jgi:hypothetical protein